MGWVTRETGKKNRDRMRIKTSVWNDFQCWDSSGLQSDASLLCFTLSCLFGTRLSLSGGENNLGQTSKGFCFSLSRPAFVRSPFAQLRKSETNRCCAESQVFFFFPPAPLILPSHVKGTLSNNQFYKCLISLLFLNKLDFLFIFTLPVERSSEMEMQISEWGEKM